MRQSTKKSIELEYVWFPRPLEKTLRTLITPYLWLIPGWCKHILIKYDSIGAPEAAAEIKVNVDYRNAVIRVYPQFFDTLNSVREREEMIVHELVHITVNQFYNYSRKEIKRLLSDAPKFAESAQERLDDELERTVQDLTFAILDKQSKHPHKSIQVSRK